MTETATAYRIEPTDTAVVEILTLNVETYDTYQAIAAALAPLVAAAPTLREWSLDDEWTVAEETVAAARSFVDGVATPVGDDPWLGNRQRLDRLRDAQKAHRESLILDRLGVFPGFQVRVNDWWSPGQRVRIWPAGLLTDITPSILALDVDVTRREVELSIAAWKAGHERGLREGAEGVRRGIKVLLDVEVN